MYAGVIIYVDVNYCIVPVVGSMMFNPWDNWNSVAVEHPTVTSRQNQSTLGCYPILFPDTPISGYATNSPKQWMVSHGFTWFHMVSHGFTWFHSLKVISTYWFSFQMWIWFHWHRVRLRLVRLSDPVVTSGFGDAFLMVWRLKGLSSGRHQVTSPVGRMVRNRRDSGCHCAKEATVTILQNIIWTCTHWTIDIHEESKTTLHSTCK